MSKVTPIKRGKPLLQIKRPMPPADIGMLLDGEDWVKDFTPATELRDWVQEHLIDSNSPLFNPDHSHLQGADLEFMWASAGFQKQGRTIVGTAEQVAFRAGGWQGRRQEHQMYQWFHRIPAFLITLDASFARQATDAQFLMVVEHELYHVAQAVDKHGALAFDRDTGRAKLCIRGHDVEEFVGVVRRYGMGESIQPLGQLVAAALAEPEVSSAAIHGACGTCLRAAA